MLFHAMQGSLHHGGHGPVVDWKPHRRSAYTVCKEYAVKSKGSRPPQRKHTTPLHGQPAKIRAT